MGPSVTAGYLLDTNHLTKAINKGSPERLEVRRLLGKGVRVGTTAKAYGEIHNDLRRRGRALSQVDMMLAALARQMKLTLVTTDRDFEALPDIRAENWSHRQS